MASKCALKRSAITNTFMTGGWNNFPQRPSRATPLSVVGVFSTLVVPTRTLYPWSPESETLEDISKAPDGRMKLKRHRAFGSTQVLVKYDERSEDLQDITFANALEADLEELREVGRAVWKAVMQTKKVIIVEFFKAEEA